MNRYIPLTIFTISFIGSLVIASLTVPIKKMIEANPIMRFMFSRGNTIAWIYGLLVVVFILLASHFGFKGTKYTRTYHITYWLLASVFLINFVREMLLVLYSPK